MLKVGAAFYAPAPTINGQPIQREWLFGLKLLEPLKWHRVGRFPHAYSRIIGIEGQVRVADGSQLMINAVPALRARIQGGDIQVWFEDSSLSGSSANLSVQFVQALPLRDIAIGN
jgi:hypothetical protein